MPQLRARAHALREGLLSDPEEQGKAGRPVPGDRFVLTADGGTSFWVTWAETRTAAPEPSLPLAGRGLAGARGPAPSAGSLGSRFLLSCSEVCGLRNVFLLQEVQLLKTRRFPEATKHSSDTGCWGQAGSRGLAARGPQGTDRVGPREVTAQGHTDTCAPTFVAVSSVTGQAGEQ